MEPPLPGDGLAQHISTSARCRQLAQLAQSRGEGWIAAPGGTSPKEYRKLTRRLSEERPAYRGVGDVARRDKALALPKNA
ncbi:hypothetical protein [Streptomyces sp. NPDC050416]|uniref:hypothetical protein n=1 Tax=Streptomyces sp. NPDC050416 TaxID=3365611 RepID=UPI0037AD168C